MDYSKQELEQIRQGRGRFLAMAGTYFMGVFNDSFFKQAALLLAIVAGKSAWQGTITILFSVPFVAFSATGGWLADRFSKHYVIIYAKGLELVAMIIGAAGIFYMNWILIMAMVFIMGLQSTIFAPALNGSIPELYPAKYVTTANSIVKLLTTLAILAGIALAGLALDQQWFRLPYNLPFGHGLIMAVVVVVALLGLLLSFAVYHSSIRDERVPFPWAGPVNSILHYKQVWSDKLLRLSLLGSTFFYGMSTMIVLFLNTFGLKQLGYSQTKTSLLSVMLMIGVSMGALLVSCITSTDRWAFIVVPAVAGLGSCLLLIPLAVCFSGMLQTMVLFLLLIIAGIFGGLLIIPITSFIQVRPQEHEKGKVIGVCNFSDFSGIILAGQLFVVMEAWLRPSTALGVLGGLCLAICLLFWRLTLGANRFECQRVAL
jgi:MFS family permease